MPDPLIAAILGSPVVTVTDERGAACWFKDDMVRAVAEHGIGVPGANYVYVTTSPRGRLGWLARLYIAQPDRHPLAE